MLKKIADKKNFKNSIICIWTPSPSQFKNIVFTTNIHNLWKSTDVGGVILYMSLYLEKEIIA